MPTFTPLPSSSSASSLRSTQRFDQKSPIPTSTNPKVAPSLQQTLSGLNEDLGLLERLRPFGDSSHNSYLHTHEHGAAPECCADIGSYPTDKHVAKKSIPVSPVEIDRIKGFADDLGSLRNSIVRRGGLDRKSIGYISEIENHARKILERATTNDRPIVKHDLNILITEVIADVVGKLAKHPNDRYTENNAKSVLGLLTKNFGITLNASEYNKFFFSVKDKTSGDVDKSITPLSPDIIVGKIKKHLGDLQNSKNRINDVIYCQEIGPGRSPRAPRLSETEAYQAGALLTLHMKKPPSPPTRMGDVKRIDHHYHNHPYDNNGEHSKFSPLKWEAEMAKWLGVQHTDIMPIPHQMTAESFDGRQPRSLTDAVRHAYYSGPGRHTEFRSHDATMLVHHNDLSPEERALFNACSTGLPIDARRVGEVRQIAHRFAHNVAAGQLEEGRKKIAVNFGEVTGYKPAVPQEMLAGTERNTSRIQGKFVERSSAVLTAIFEASQQGIAQALNEYKEKNPGKSIEGIQTKTRVTFHADALPNDNALRREVNFKPDGTAKEATVMANIREYAKSIDSKLSRMYPPDFPEGVKHEHHLQAAHLMGASIEPNNFQDPSRATELHAAFKDFRQNCGTLRVTTDASWLTASARAVNCGMHAFFDQSEDPDIKEIATLVKTADDLSNNCFMFLHGGERFFEIHLLNGDNEDASILNMATMRSAQKKATRTYHSTLGALHDKLKDPEVNRKFSDYVKKGIDEATGLVKPGNYPALFLELAQDRNLGKQDPMPIVWGTDNLTASEARSGDLKMLQYVSQHGPLEIMLLNLGDQAKGPLLDFLAGSRDDQEYSGATAKISQVGIRDGAFPADLESTVTPKTHHPRNPLLHVRAPQDAGGAGALPSKKERILGLKDDRPSQVPDSVPLDSKRSVGN